MNASSSNPKVVRVHFQPRKEDAPSPVSVTSGPPDNKWSLQRWLFVIALIFVMHLTAIFVFAEYKFPAPRPVMNVPHLQLANHSAGILALEDPTVFVLPRAGDLASVGLLAPVVAPPAFRWSEAPHFLPLPSQMLGAAFHQFMQTNFTRTALPDFKPAPRLSAPVIMLQPVFADRSSWQLEGELAGRKLLSDVGLTNWPYADVIAPSRVQLVVNENGEVLSAVLLPLNSPKNEIRYAEADDYALKIARGLQFAPGPHLTVGNILFNWHTVPPPPTDSAAIQ